MIQDYRYKTLVTQNTGLNNKDLLIFKENEMMYKWEKSQKAG